MMMPRLETRQACYVALSDALDMVKAVQTASLRGVLPADQQLAARVAEARAALDRAIETLYPTRPPR